MRSFLNKLKKTWTKVWPVLRVLLSILSFLGVGEALSRYVLQASLLNLFRPYLSYMLVSVLSLLAGTLLSSLVSRQRNALSVGLRTVIHRRLTVANVYREIGEIATLCVEPDSNSGQICNLEHGSSTKELAALLERVGWLLGDKVYNVSLHIPCSAKRHLWIVGLIPTQLFKRRPFSIDSSASGKAYKSKRSVIISNIKHFGERSDSKYSLSKKYAAVEQVPYHSLLCIPLQTARKAEDFKSAEVVGVLCVNSIEIGAFSEDEDVMLAPILPQLALFAKFLGVVSPCSACLQEKSQAEQNRLTIVK